MKDRWQGRVACYGCKFGAFRGATGCPKPPRPAEAVWKRFGPLAVLVAGLLAFWVFDLGRFVSFEVLRAHREALTDLVAVRPISGGVVAAVGYALVVAFSLPVASLMTLVVGFLFGQIWGTVIVVAGATVGALAVFTAARSALGGGLRAGRAVRASVAGGFQANAELHADLRWCHYSLWLVNIVPAMLQVPTRVFVLTTAIGIVPGSFVFVGLGNGMGHILEAGELPGLAVFAAPEVLMPLVLLAALSALPILYKRWRGAPGTGEK